jgi:hypothetical protein
MAEIIELNMQFSCRLLRKKSTFHFPFFRKPFIFLTCGQQICDISLLFCIIGDKIPI